MRAGITRHLAILFALLAATACDLNPRPEDPGAKLSTGGPRGTLGSGGMMSGSAGFTGIDVPGGAGFGGTTTGAGNTTGSGGTSSLPDAGTAPDAGDGAAPDGGTDDAGWHP